MRTTLAIDDDVARLLHDEMARTRRSLKEVVNDLLRRGLAAAAERPAEPFRVQARDLQLKAGIDEGHFNRLVDELEIEQFAEDRGAGYRGGRERGKG